VSPGLLEATPTLLDSRARRTIKFTLTGPRDAALAGIMLVSSLVVGAAIGFGVGSVFGAEVPLAFAGGCIGLIVGFRLVYTRFKDL
jgi:hypothetical protein